MQFGKYSEINHENVWCAVNELYLCNPEKKSTDRSLSFKQVNKNKIKIGAYLFFSKKNDMYLCNPVKKTVVN